MREPGESPSIRELVEQLPTDAILTAIVEDLAEMRAEVELNRLLLIELHTKDMSDEDRKKYLFRLAMRKSAIMSATTGEWRARVEMQNKERL